MRTGNGSISRALRLVLRGRAETARQGVEAVIRARAPGGARSLRRLTEKLTVAHTRRFGLSGFRLTRLAQPRLGA